MKKPAAPKFSAELEALIKEGKTKGHVTYEELNRMLPEDFSTEDMETLFAQLEGLKIAVRDLAEEDEEESGKGTKGAKKSAKSSKRKGETATRAAATPSKGVAAGDVIADDSDEAESAELRRSLMAQPIDTSRIDDPVRLYLMEMGKVPLLTREEEVFLAKQIEKGRHEIMAAISRATVTAGELNRIYARIETGQFNLNEVLRANVDESDPEERARIIKHILDNLKLVLRTTRSSPASSTSSKTRRVTRGRIRPRTRRSRETCARKSTKPSARST
jgi:RNA polymerase primary sigma factor